DGIGRIVLEQVAVFLDEGAAAAGGLHDGLGTSLDGRPPGVDVATSAVQPGFLGVEVVVHRATATGFTNGRDADAEAIQHPRGGRVGVARRARLHATCET